MQTKLIGLDLDPWKELQKKLRRVAVYAIEKAGVKEPDDFERLARQTFQGVFDRSELFLRRERLRRKGRL